MLKLTDFYDDVNQQRLYSLEKLTGVPSFVKQSSAEPKDEIRRLPAHAFADPQHRKFPLHTKAATWLANAYFRQQSATYGKDERSFIQDRITKAANYWKIASVVKEFNQAWDRLNAFHAPQDLPDDQYALIYKAGEQTVKKFPIPNSVCVKMAGERLFADRHRYPYYMRKFAARRLLKRASPEMFDNETTDFLKRASGEGGAIPYDVSVKLAQRAIMIKPKHPKMAMKLAELAETIEGDRYISRERLEKLAHLVDAVDRETGLYHYYHEGVPMPEEFIFNIQQKEAEAFVGSHIKLSTGNVYAMKDLLNLPLQKLADVMGKDFVEAVSNGLKIDAAKFAEIVPTLPRDDASLLEKAIQKAAADVIPGGKAQGMPTSAFPKSQIEKGIEVEKEHTSSPAVATEIAKDHLVEAKDYYEPRLDKMEQKIEKDKEEGKIEGVGKEARDMSRRFDPDKMDGEDTARIFQEAGHVPEKCKDFKMSVKLRPKP